MKKHRVVNEAEVREAPRDGTLAQQEADLVDAGLLVTGVDGAEASEIVWIDRVT